MFHIYIHFISLTVKIKKGWVNSKMCKLTAEGGVTTLYLEGGVTTLTAEGGVTTLTGGRSNNTVPGGRSNNTDRREEY